MTPDQVDALAQKLNVKREAVIEMETSLTGRDIALEAPTDDDDDHFAPIAFLSSELQEPTRMLENGTAPCRERVGHECEIYEVDGVLKKQQTQEYAYNTT